MVVKVHCGTVMGDAFQHGGKFVPWRIREFGRRSKHTYTHTYINFIKVSRYLAKS